MYSFYLLAIFEVLTSINLYYKYSLCMHRLKAMITFVDKYTLRHKTPSLFSKAVTVERHYQEQKYQFFFLNTVWVLWKRCAEVKFLGHVETQFLGFFF